MSMNIAASAAAASVQANTGASWGAPPQQKMSNLFDGIDTANSGSISQAQFQQAFQTKNPPGVFKQQGADALFAQLDPAGTGSVSKSAFVAKMADLMVSLRADAPPSSAPTPSDTLASTRQALDQGLALGSTFNVKA